MTGAELARLVTDLDDWVAYAICEASCISAGCGVEGDRLEYQRWYVNESILADLRSRLAELLGTPGLVDFVAAFAPGALPPSAQAPASAP